MLQNCKLLQKTTTFDGQVNICVNWYWNQKLRVLQKQMLSKTRFFNMSATVPVGHEGVLEGVVGVLEAVGGCF